MPSLESLRKEGKCLFAEVEYINVAALQTVIKVRFVESAGRISKDERETITFETPQCIWHFGEIDAALGGRFPITVRVIIQANGGSKLAEEDLWYVYVRFLCMLLG